MFKTIKNAFKTPDVRKRILYTLLLIVLFRLGCFITVPGVNTVTLNEAMSGASNGIAGLIDLISGGAFSRFSIFAMTITPYITSSIVIQLLGMVIPSLEKLMKEGGEEGRNKMNRYTKLLTVVLALIEGIGLFLTYKSSGIFVETNFLTGFLVVISLMAGTSLLMWLGDQITNKGIGNGISMIIFVGIISGLPSAVTMIWNLIFGTRAFSTAGLLTSLCIIVGAIVLIAGVVFVQQAERRIPVQYAKRIVGNKQYGGARQYIPLKVNAANVMPIIFAQAIMFIPITIVGFSNMEDASGITRALIDHTSFWYNFVFAALIILFTYFYTAITINTNQMAEDMKRNNGFIPGIKPGKNTAEYLDVIMSRITLPGSIFLAIIAILPAFAGLFGVQAEFAQFFGGTSLLILVGVVLDTLQQVESHLLMRHYDGLLSSGRIKGRSGNVAAY